MARRWRRPCWPWMRPRFRPAAPLTVEFTFPDSAAGADLEFSCLIRRHYEDGMWLDITVTS